MKFLLVLALAAVAYAGHASHGHQGWGHEAGHGHGGHGHHGGWGRQYHGWASVKSHQTPHNYNYGLQEQGKGYSKYIWQGADAHASHGWQPKQQGWGWGHGGGHQG